MLFLEAVASSYCILNSSIIFLEFAQGDTVGARIEIVRSRWWTDFYAGTSNFQMLIIFTFIIISMLR